MDDSKTIIKLLEQQGKILTRIAKLLESKEKEVPKIPKSQKIIHKRTSVPALLLFLKEDKFFDEPKTLNDIVLKLKEESRNVRSTSLTLPLQRLVRSRELGRVLKNGKWHYIAR